MRQRPALSGAPGVVFVSPLLRAVRVGGGLQAPAGEREDVDQPAGAAADVVGAQERVELAVDGWAGAREEVLADAEIVGNRSSSGWPGSVGPPQREQRLV